MNYFADELERQLTAKKMSQVDLAARSGISQSQISKWLRAEQTSVAAGQMSSLAGALSKDIHDHAALVRAHLMDEKFGPGSHLVKVTVDSNLDKPRARSRGETAINFLADLRLEDRTTNDLLINLARSLGCKF